MHPFSRGVEASCTTTAEGRGSLLPSILGHSPLSPLPSHHPQTLWSHLYSSRQVMSQSPRVTPSSRGLLIAGDSLSILRFQIFSHPKRMFILGNLSPFLAERAFRGNLLLRCLLLKRSLSCWQIDSLKVVNAVQSGRRQSLPPFSQSSGPVTITGRGRKKQFVDLGVKKPAPLGGEEKHWLSHVPGRGNKFSQFTGPVSPKKVCQISPGSRSLCTRAACSDPPFAWCDKLCAYTLNFILIAGRQA